MQVVKIALYLSAMAFFVNCGINYTLIFGHFGAPELGTAGAAVGTLIARILETTVLILYIAKTEKNLCMKVKDFFRFDRQLWKDYIKVTAPILFTNGLWGVNTAMQTAILGHMTQRRSLPILRRRICFSLSNPPRSAHLPRQGC